MKKEIKHVVFLGETGFPFGFASIQRMTLISKALISIGVEVTVLCRKGVWNEGQHSQFGWQGKYEGINYLYVTKDVCRPKGFFKRNFTKVRGAYGEYRYLAKLKRLNKLDSLLVSNMKFIHLFRYLTFSKRLKVPVIRNLVEMSSAIEGRDGLALRLNDYLVEKWLNKQFDGVMPISDKLMAYHQGIAPEKPRMKLPVLCDFKKFDVPKELETKTDYFLYCGSINYLNVIEFILECYSKLDSPNAKLYMIVSGGSKQETKLLETEMNGKLRGSPIKLFSNIPYDELVHLYNHAMALLIPLRPTVQDEARFPHKIGEYLASGNPVVTTNIGEVATYFKDGETAYVAKKYELVSFSEKMKEILFDREKARKVGLNGRVLGLNEFDYKVHGPKLQNFLSSLSTREKD